MFGPASREEKIVFGSEMPGYRARSIPLSVILKWISSVKKVGIKRVCCLLAESQLAHYEVDLLAVYREHFGAERVLWAPIPDFHLASVATLERILAFLRQADETHEPVVVHCAGGRGRTGHVLAAWLVYGRGFSMDKAIAAVQATGRNPLEAVEEGNATTHDLESLLQTCATLQEADVTTGLKE